MWLCCKALWCIRWDRLSGNFNLNIHIDFIYLTLSLWLAYGFLASQEVAEERLGNFGLYDRTFFNHFTIAKLRTTRAERVGLRWVQKYIGLFGGDASQVTM